METKFVFAVVQLLVTLFMVINTRDVITWSSPKKQERLIYGNQRIAVNDPDYSMNRKKTTDVRSKSSCLGDKARHTGYIAIRPKRYFYL